MHFSRLLARAGSALVLGCTLSLSTTYAQAQTLQPLQQLEPDDAEVFPTPDELTPVGFGSDIAIEGKRALISMPAADRGAGRIAIFRLDTTGQWQRAGRLRFSSAPNGVRHVELRGGIAVVASDDSVYVARPAANGVWTAVRRFQVDAGDYIQGLSYDGQTAVIGASGGVYIYTINQQTLARRQKIVAPSGLASDAFGRAVAVFGDTLVVGAPGYNDGQGAIHVYQRNGLRWARTQTLLAADGEPMDDFGSAIAARYGLIMVGAPGADAEFGGEFDELMRMGAAFAFAPHAGRWIQTQKVSPANDGAEYFLNFGTHIEINGGRVIIGAPGFRGLTYDAGSLYVYKRHGSTLSALTQAIDSNELGYMFTVWGNTLIAGLVEPSFYTGRALVYDLGILGPAVPGPVGPSPVGPIPVRPPVAPVR